MAWDTTMVSMMRTLIQDFDSTYFTYSRLKEILVVAAQYVITEVDLSVTYTINIVTPSISPDPTTASPVDNAFVNLAVMKAACLIDRGSLRSAALLSGLEARCGPAMMKTLQRMDGFNTLIIQGYCATYEELKQQYRFGNISWCQGFLSPFISSNFFPDLVDPNLDHRVK